MPEGSCNAWRNLPPPLLKYIKSHRPHNVWGEVILRMFLLIRAERLAIGIDGKSGRSDLQPHGLRMTERFGNLTSSYVVLANEKHPIIKGFRTVSRSYKSI